MSARYEYQRESRFERHVRTAAIILAAVLLGLSAAGVAIRSLHARHAASSSIIANQPQ